MLAFCRMDGTVSVKIDLLLMGAWMHVGLRRMRSEWKSCVVTQL